MTLLEIALLAVTSLFTTTLTSMLGFGGGIILMGVVLLFMPPMAAIPFHGLLQLIANAWRVVLFRRHVSWPLTLRFMALLPVGVLVGLWFFQGLSAALIQFLIGCVVLLSLFARRLKALRHRDLPLGAFWPLGFVVGILNMMVGVVGPLLGVAVVRRELNKEQVIGTLGFFALAGHVCKVVAFGLAGFSFQTYLPALAAIVPAMLLGGWLGKWLLTHFNEQVFMVFFQLLLVVLAVKLIVWEGLLALL